MIGQPATRIGIHRAEQSLERVKEADDEDACAKGFEILGCEAEPEPFTCSGENQSDEQQRRVPAQREKIRDAAFVLVDLTHENSGAYWEAGYAEGLGKPVLYICERAKFEAAKTHFDTNHLTTVLWEAHKPHEFIEQLIATLRRSLNLFPTS